MRMPKTAMVQLPQDVGVKATVDTGGQVVCTGNPGQPCTSTLSSDITIHHKSTLFMSDMQLSEGEFFCV